MSLVFVPNRLLELNGRSSRLSCLIEWLLILVLFFPLSFLIGAVPGMLIGLTLHALCFIRRAHDFNWSGGRMGLLMLSNLTFIALDKIVLLYLMFQIIRPYNGVYPLWLVYGVYAAKVLAIATSLLTFGLMFLRKGTPGDNRYGAPDSGSAFPRAARAEPAPAADAAPTPGEPK